MRNLTLALTGLAALAFVLAVVASFTGSGSVGYVQAESFSRASTNLSLLAIALVLISKDSGRRSD